MTDILIKFCKTLQRAGDPVRAPVMQAYMKSAMPYHGVPAPQLRTTCKTTFADLQFASRPNWQAQVLELSRNARFREERYAALYLAGHKPAQLFQTVSSMKLYEELIVTGAWWDYGDRGRSGTDENYPLREAHYTGEEPGLDGVRFVPRKSQEVEIR